jgi:hypothetical protein
MKKLLLLLGILFTLNVKGQVIQFVQYSYQADIKVNFVDYKYQADIVVSKVDNKYQTNKPGYWYFIYSSLSNSGYYSNSTLKVYVVPYNYQADFNVYVSNSDWDVRVTDEYLNAIK